MKEKTFKAAVKGKKNFFAVFLKLAQNFIENGFEQLQTDFSPNQETSIFPHKKHFALGRSSLILIRGKYFLKYYVSVEAEFFFSFF